jgi:hypothetical protein
MMRILLVALLAAAGCYAGPRAAADVNAAWRGKSSAELQGRWGKPADVQRAATGGARMAWSHSHHHFELPSAEAELTVEPGHIEGMAAVSAGKVWTTATVVTADVDAAGTVVQVSGPSLRWGPPDDANLRWGGVFGAHVGMGRLDDATSPRPSGGLYLGGMLGPRLALVGCFSLASGSGPDGAAMNFGGGMAVQYWPATRLWLRAGPAAVLDLEPGFDGANFGVGALGGASVALLRHGTFVLDLRLDLVTSTAATFGTVGVGVNVN